MNDDDDSDEIQQDDPYWNQREQKDDPDLHYP